MTKNGRSATGEIDMGRDLISLDLGNGEVVHIPENPVSTETVHIRRDLDDIGTGHSPRSQGNAGITYILGRIKLGIQSPQRKGNLVMLLLGTYFYVNGISFEKTHFICIWVNLSRFKMIIISG